jgi:two-component system, response regulator FlrC
MSVSAGAAPIMRPATGAVLARSALAPVARSVAMREVLAAAEDVAVAATTVLILGESGTGKEIVARHIHRCSPRAAMPWIAVNCAALPADLLEGELFGHERGAFTGATERRIGRIEQADRGTLLLDEISELPLGLQAKLLRVLQEREIDRIGGTRAIPVDVRIIATSNRSLLEMVERKEFRADLYYRLDVFPIQLPPLRERRDDIPDLVAELLQALSSSLGRQAPVLAAEALSALAVYAFPGNVRELGNILERALVRCREPVLDLRHLNLPPASNTSRLDTATGRCGPGGTCQTFSEVARLGDPLFPAGLPLDLPTLERLAIGEALRVEMGNRTRAARRLGVSLRTLRNKLRLYREAQSADGQGLPGTDDPAHQRVSTTTLARPSQTTSSRRAA